MALKTKVIEGSWGSYGGKNLVKMFEERIEKAWSEAVKDSVNSRVDIQYSVGPNGPTALLIWQTKDK